MDIQKLVMFPNNKTMMSLLLSGHEITVNLRDNTFSL